MNGLETYLLVISVARDTSFMLYPLLSRFAISFRCPVAKVFLPQKVLQTDLTDALNCTENLNFSSDVPAELSSEDSDFTSDFRVSALQACWVLLPNL